MRGVGVEALENQRTSTSSDVKDLDNDPVYVVLLDCRWLLPPL